MALPTLNLTEYLSGLNYDALDNNVDAVSHVIDFPINNADIHNREYIYHLPANDIDLIDDIRITSVRRIHVEYLIGGNVYQVHEIDVFAKVAAIYHDFVIRITFLEDIQPDDRFVISYRNTLLKNSNREKLMRCRLLTKNNIYSDGMCLRQTPNDTPVKTNKK